MVLNAFRSSNFSDAYLGPSIALYLMLVTFEIMNSQGTNLQVDKTLPFCRPFVCSSIGGNAQEPWGQVHLIIILIIF